MTLEIKAHLSAKLKGRIPWNKGKNGKPWSEETSKKR